MENICILLYGFRGSGKSTFSNYLRDNYNASYLHVRRTYRAKYNSEPPPSYPDMHAESGDKSHWYYKILDEINQVKEKPIVIIEGLFSVEEYLWWKSVLKNVFVVFTEVDETLRFKRFLDRENSTIEKAIEDFSKSNEFREGAGTLKMKKKADIIFYNNDDMDTFIGQIEQFMKIIGIEHA
jgi:dephospho-CoA kinase